MKKVDDRRKKKKYYASHPEAVKRIRERARLRRMHKKIQRYSCFLEGTGSVSLKKHPDTGTLCIWIRECRRAGMYKDGRILFEKGDICFDDLPETQKIELFEDYIICMRTLKREEVISLRQDESESGDTPDRDDQGNNGKTNSP